MIAVDTSLGTNFLLSASEDTTVSELRGLIQKEHMSCFPEHESISIGALMVEYDHKQYHLTESLLVGQVLKKSWNKIHAEVSSRFPRSSSTSNNPKPTRVGSFANGRTGNLCATLDGPPFKCSEALPDAMYENLSTERQASSKEAPAQRPSALLCQAKTSKDSNGLDSPSVSNQECLNAQGNFGCPLPSMEAPYTQPCSELNAVTLATLSRGVLGRRRKHQKTREDFEKDKVLVKKQNQAEPQGQKTCKPIHERELSPDNMQLNGIKPRGKTDEDEISFERLRQCKQDIECRDGISREAPSSEAQNCHKNLEEEQDHGDLRQNSEGINDLLSLDDPMVKDRTRRDQKVSISFTDAATTNLQNLKLSSMGSESQHYTQKGNKSPISLGAAEQAENCVPKMRCFDSSASEKGFSASQRNSVQGKDEESVSQTSDKAETEACCLCPGSIKSTRSKEEGNKETSADTGVQRYLVDKSSEDPIQLNDHNILLIASLSADIVLETQESQMDTQIGIALMREEDRTDIKEHLKDCEQDHIGDAKKVSSEQLPTSPENSEIKAVKQGNSNVRALEISEHPSKSLCPEEFNAVVKTVNFGQDDGEQPLGAIISNDNNISVPKKRKKRKRRKGLEMHNILARDECMFANRDCEEQDIEGDAGPEKTFHESINLRGIPIKATKDKCEMSCQGKIQDNFDGPGSLMQINFKSHDDLSVASQDLESSKTERQKRNLSRGATSCTEAGNCNNTVDFSSENRATVKTRSNKSSAKVEGGEKHMEGSLIGGCNTVGTPLEYMDKNFGLENCMGVEENVERESDRAHRKRKKRRKEQDKFVLDQHVDAVMDNTRSDLEGAQVDKCVDQNDQKECRLSFVKENEQSPNIVKLADIEKDELNPGDTELDDPVGGGQVKAKKLKQKNIVIAKSNTAPNSCLIQHQNMSSVVHENVDDTDSPLQEGLFTTERGFDVFEFGSSETGNQQQESSSYIEMKSDKEAQNLDKLCSDAVRTVEDDMLNILKMRPRKTGRKAINPKRWMALLSERLTRTQSPKCNSKKNMSNKPTIAGPCLAEMPSDGDSYPKACYAEGEAKEVSNQIIMDDGKIACPAGCGRIYAKKTSAYYRHRQKCSGS